MPSSVQSRMDTLLRDLRARAIERRSRAARELREFGMQAVEPLCLALKDQDVNVRLAAIESLGHIGDVRAVQPLLEAWQACFIGRSARWQYAAWLLLLVMTSISWIWKFFGDIASIIASSLMLLIGTFALISRYYGRRRSQGRVCRAIMEAFVHIAERNPSPELRVLLPELRAIVVDRRDSQTIAMARETAQRIETLTEQLKSLPLPAAVPAPDAATLPRAADANAPETERLPRVTVNE